MSSSLALSDSPSLISPRLGQVALDRLPVKLGVMSSGSGSNFEAIAQAISDQRLNAQIEVLVYNNPGAAVNDRATRWGIPSMLVDHRAFGSREELDRAIVQILQTAEVDWVIMAGWMRIVTPVFIHAFDQRILNIHPSLLPSFKGNRAIEQALEAKVKIAGCTCISSCPKSIAARSSCRQQFRCFLMTPLKPCKIGFIFKSIWFILKRSSLRLRVLEKVRLRLLLK